MLASRDGLILKLKYIALFFFGGSVETSSACKGQNTVPPAIQGFLAVPLLLFHPAKLEKSGAGEGCEFEVLDSLTPQKC